MADIPVDGEEERPRHVSCRPPRSSTGPREALGSFLDTVLRCRGGEIAIAPSHHAGTPSRVTSLYTPGAWAMDFLESWGVN